jgi:neutral ceramidase
MALAVSVPARWRARVPPRVTRRDQRVDKKRSSSSARATRGSPSSPGEADASGEASAPTSAGASAHFFAGVGVGDCTGPMDGVGMMGYARVSQISSGLRQRQKARAFVVAEARPSFLRVRRDDVDDTVSKESKEDDGGLTSTSTSTSIVALVVVDACMVFPDLKPVVLRRVAERIETAFGVATASDAAAVFNQDNLCVCATHTHSAPGGYAPHGLYNVTFGGAVSESFDALARGAAEALFEAFADAFRSETKTRTVAFARGSLVGVSANRSRSAFDLNPEIETAPFAMSGGVDETFSALVIGARESRKIEKRGAGGFEAPRGVAAWYAVHGTSLPGSNTLISGDNKGIASSLTESAMRSAVAGDESAVRALEALFRRVGETEGKPRARGLADADVVASAASAAARVVTSGFERRSSECQSDTSDTKNTPSIVAAFPQSASGDVSPNVLGAFDARAGTACDGSRAERDGGSAGGFAFLKNPRVRDCVGRGPSGTEGDRFLSCLVTGTAQAAACVSLLDGAARVSGPVRAAARWVPIGREGGAAAARAGDRAAAADRTATPALGYSFAAGTTDGPGENGFTQGDRDREDDATERTKKNKNKQRFLGRVATFLFGGAFGVSKETRVAHAPKPVLVAFPDADEDETDDETRFFPPGARVFKRRFRRNPPLGWVQRDVQVQVFRIGRVLIASVPAEVTTVAGKRLEDAAARAARRHDPTSRGSGEEQTWSTVVNGLANGYSGYVTTAEEYAAQRYEGASTLYGPNTLRLYERVVAELVAELVAEREDEAEDETEDETESSYARAEPSEVYEDFRKSFRDESVQSLVPPFDTRWPPGTKFGEVVLGPNGKRHSETDSGKRHDDMCVRVGAGGDDGEARVSFLAGRPRRLSTLREKSLSDVGINVKNVLVVERFDARLREWHVIADDDDVSTIVEWDAHGPLWLASRLTLSWRPPEGTKPGTYRVGVAGAARTVSSALASFLGKGVKKRRRADAETPEDESLEFFRGFSEPFEVLAGKGGE